MSGVSGVAAELKKITDNAKFAALEIHKSGIKLSLELAVESTIHSSSNAAFNWRVVHIDSAAGYTDSHNVFPVGDYFESRSRTGAGSKMQIVGAVVVARENQNFIDSMELIPVSISNATGDFEGDGYEHFAALESVEGVVVSRQFTIESGIISNLKQTRAGLYIES